MATNHTEVYGLNQWVHSDSVLMADFNEDNVKIEQALLDLKASMPKIATGSYVGTGESGPENPNTLEFDFTPQLVIITVAGQKPTDNSPYTFVRPWEYGNSYSKGNTSSNTYYIRVTWTDNSLIWYAQFEDGDPAPGGQLNREGVTYYYFAIG